MMSKNQMNDIVFEALFRQAVIDDFNEEINSIESNEELSKIYSFSTEFETRMKRLLTKDRRKEHVKKTMYYSRKVASIVIIVLGLLFSSLLLNTEVRATVGKVLVEWYEKFTTFSFRDDVVIDENKDWILGYIPEGYEQKNYEELGRIKNIEYSNVQGDKIRFSYVPDNSITNISVDNENHEIDTFILLGNKAYSIMATNNEFDNGIIWNMEGYTFDLWGKLSINELERIAESIVKNK
ncbi:MAG: DUF4367 domain-containing protein [Tissierellia bacterium]|nr:DUF4367 domain-containing protein [Tissierellia bacterium]